MQWKGDRISFEVYGTSHAPEIGVVATGVPYRPLDGAALARFMDRRRAKNEAFSTKRIEADNPEIEYGENGFRAVIKNTDVKSGDYADLYGIPRPSHADYAAHLRDGRLDFSGGGEFSGRLTAPLCVLGFVAKSILAERGIKVSAWVSAIGGVKGASYRTRLTEAMLSCGDEGEWTPAKKEEMLEEIRLAAADKDSVGGRIECAVTGLAGGIGGGSYGSLEGKVASLAYLIPAVKGVEFGAGFDLARMRGSEANDPLYYDEKGKVVFEKNDAGGINGGLSNGNAVTLAVAVRPTPSIGKKQRSISLTDGEDREIEIKGRHDACIACRAVPVLEAAVAIAVLDALLTEEKK